MALNPPLENVVTVPQLLPRAAEANKGTFGRVLVVAGSRGMSGAPVLCATAALRGGAGLVRVAIPAGIQAIVASANPCYMTAALPEDTEGRLDGRGWPALLEQVKWSTVAAVGPGLGHSPALGEMLRNLVAGTPSPLVIDADGLNGLAEQPAGFTTRNGKPALILTPHPGEFGRLTGLDIATIQAARQEHAVRYARDKGVVLVLKGQGTVVTDGQRVYVNTTGNPGMATGGTGDVLGGLIAALVAQGLEAFAAAQLGVDLHGLAGDLARDDLGETSLIASDLLTYLPRAFLAHAREGRRR
jgi:NAD(P)H-hydrate epimerase